MIRVSILCFLPLGACALTAAEYGPPPKAPPRYYVASFDVDREDRTNSLLNRAEALSQDAGAVLAKGRRVAFFPPDNCVNTPSTQGVSGTTYIKMECGVLMSVLETHMARAGYEVVSWQALKPATSGLGASQAGNTVLERARALGVEVVFEVDELAEAKETQGQTRVTDLRLYREDGVANRTPVTVSEYTASGCKALSDKVVGLSTTERKASALSAKAVEVSTGRAVWYYQKTRAHEVQASRSMSTDYYFVSRGSWPAAPPVDPPYNVLQRSGNAAVIGGALVGLVGAVVAVVGAGAGGTQAGSSAAPIFYGGAAGAGLGLGLTVAGGAMVGAGNRRNAEPLPYPEELDVDYPTPDDVICEGASSVPNPWRRDDDEATPVRAKVMTSGSRFSYEDHTGGSKPNEQPFLLTVEDFVAELERVAAKLP